MSGFPRLFRGLVAALVVATLLPVGTVAAEQPATLVAEPETERVDTVRWSGELDMPAPLDCGRKEPVLAEGCDVTPLDVVAPKGTWITVSVEDQGTTVRVTHEGTLVGNAGSSVVSPSANPEPVTTFEQVATGRVTYAVAVGTAAASPANVIPYTVTARLAGEAFDRTGDCFVTTPAAERLLDAGTAETPVLDVRLVAEPADEAEVRRAGETLEEIYRRIAVPVEVSYDFMPLVDDGAYPFVQVRRRYGGVRPPGVDVVHVMTDLFAGGYADCIGGIAYAEKAFSVGNVHYSTPGGAAVDGVPGGMVAAHEIGHLLGAQHQDSNCAEALPQQAAQPPSDGWIGPCTVMNPAALTASETFSTVERTTIRAYVDEYADRL